MKFSVALPYIIVLALGTYLIRALPLVLVKKKIENKFALSFLSYMPYAVLSVMTFPAIFYSTNNVATAAVGVAVAMLLAFFKCSLLTVAIGASVGTFIAEVIVKAGLL